MALAIDASTPAEFSTATTLSITSASFTPPAGSLLVVLYGANGGSSQDVSIASISNTGTGFTWARRARKNKNAASNGGAGEPGGAEIWTAVATVSQSMTVTVTGVDTGSGRDKWAKIVVLTGADTNTLTNVGAASNGSGLPSVALTGCVAGSYVFAAASDWAQAGNCTPGTAQTLIDEYDNAGQISIHGWRTTNTLAAAGSQTMNLTAPSGEDYNMVVLEVRASTESVVASPIILTAPGRNSPNGIWVPAPVDLTPPAEAVSVNAEETAATGTAYDATVAISVSAENAAGTGAATDTVTSVEPAAGTTTGTGLAADATVAVGANAEATAGTGTALDTSADVTVNAGTTTAAGAASDATADLGVSAETTAASGAAFDPYLSGIDPTAAPWTAPAPGRISPSGVWTLLPGDPTATGADVLVSLAGHAFAAATAYDATIDVGANAETTAATGAAGDAQADLGVAGGTTTGTGAALDTQAGVGAASEIATGTGTANDAAAGLAVAAEPTAALGVGLDASFALEAAAELAAATGTALDASLALAVAADPAPGTGVGYNATVSGSGSPTTAAAECATSTGTAFDATVEVVGAVVERWTGGWWQLLGILRDGADQARLERRRGPEACPKCGEPLRSQAGGNSRHCTFDGYLWPRDDPEA